MFAVHLTRVDLVCVGSLAADVARLVDDYERRLSRYVRYEVHEIKAEPTKRGTDLVTRAEGERIAALLDRLVRPGSSMVVRLDPRGDLLDTETLAERWLGAEHLVLVIGGTMGLAAELRPRMTHSVSFGRITLPHQLARLVCTEQVYRAFRIARGEPYHF